MEMILVLSIIALLVGLGVSSLSNVTEGAELVATKANVQTMETNITAYKTLAGHVPSQGQGLEALFKRPSGSPQPKMWLQRISSASALIDAWGEPFQYRNPGKHGKIDIFSKGPDKQEGTDDDIGNWD
jgi:general secretion pathway protein G